MQPDSLEFIRAQIDTDEQWALACNRPYEYADEGGTPPPDGVHWQWVAGPNWEPVTPDPVTMEHVEGPDEEFRVHLATVEEWPSTTFGDTRMMSRAYDGGIEEMDPSAAGHIARHDPARVLAQVAAHRAILDEYETAVRSTHSGSEASAADILEPVVRHLATVYASREGWREEWRPA